ncbi:MAG: dephospho-CoA kinase [Chitinivibrionia bacterium]|nr:dephospho-CoA kinase [Chitinivibrionia bacterium]
MIIGISGYTGGGKSSAAKYLAEKAPSFFLVDADKIARKIMLENCDLINEVAKNFNVVKNGKIDFAKLGNVAFESVENLKKLNSITFPYIISAINNEICKTKFLIMDIALLPLVSSLCEKCDFLIWIESDVEKRVERLQKRSGLDVCAIKNRVQKQMDLMPAPVEESLWKIVENNSSFENLFEKIDEICNKYALN